MKTKAQVWVETAVYTLIGLTIITILLAVVTPQIEKIKDKSIIEQTVMALNDINTKIEEAEQAPGSIRIINLKIAKGSINIDSPTNEITYTLENTKLELSEPGEEIQEGNIKIKTEEQGSKFKITLTMSYPNLQLTYNNQEAPKTLQAGTQPYKINIENIGDQLPSKPIHLDFSLI
ncbi:MAG: hypothetical protein ABIJ14_04070 [Nanoarchaeota archaeon]